MKSIEQLRLEAEEAQKAVAEAERKAREEAREAKAKLERAERERKWKLDVEKWAIHGTKLVEALKAEGFEATSEAPTDGASFSYPCPRVKIVGVSEHGRISISFDSMRSGSGYFSRHAGYKIRVGNYGDAKDFRQLKDGTFKYENVAKEVKARYELAVDKAKRAEKEQNAIEKANTLAQQIRKACGLNADDGMITGYTSKGYYDHRHRYIEHKRVAKPGHVLYGVGTLELTPDKALELTKALRELGLIGEKNLLIRDAK